MAGGPQNDRLSELLKGEKWEEPIARPKGRAREDVLLAALEDVMRDARNKHEAEAKKSEQVTRAASPPRRPRASATPRQLTCCWPATGAAVDDGSAGPDRG